MSQNRRQFLSTIGGAAAAFGFKAEANAQRREQESVFAKDITYEQLDNIENYPESGTVLQKEKYVRDKLTIVALLMGEYASYAGNIRLAGRNELSSDDVQEIPQDKLQETDEELKKFFTQKIKVNILEANLRKLQAQLEKDKNQSELLKQVKEELTDRGLDVIDYNTKWLQKLKEEIEKRK